MAKRQNTQTPQAAQGIQPDQDGITLLVFKDNFAARTFRIPLAWISQFGLLVGVLTATALLSSILAVKFHRTASRANPVRVIDLEQEISELRATNKTLEAKMSANPLAHTTTAAPSVAKEPVAPPTSQPAPASGLIPLFTAFPSHVVDVSAQTLQLPFVVSPAKTQWRGKVLNVDFNIQYTGTDKGSQQGRIILLARGPDTLLSYPDAVLNRAGNASLIAPDQGEYFSVSRFREVHAEFGPVRVQGALKDVEIMILSREGRLLVYQKITPSVTAAPAAAPVAVPKAAAPTNKPSVKPSAAVPAPPKATEEVIEPGADQ